MKLSTWSHLYLSAATPHSNARRPTFRGRLSAVRRAYRRRDGTLEETRRLAARRDARVILARASHRDDRDGPFAEATRATHLDADPRSSFAVAAVRGITTKSPLEAELEQQRAVEEMERAQAEMREEAARIASARGTSASTSAPSTSPSKPKPKPKPAPPMFGAPLGGGVARTPSAPVAEKPQPKRTVVKAPTLGIAMHSDGRAGPAGNRNLMPEPPPEKTDTSQLHLKDMLADGSFERYGVGGLDAEFLTIFRRVFASRMVPPEMVAKLGMRHVKGMLLYGPPGTGKTLVARQLGKLLNAHPPKIVNGPEILQRFVGQSEENMRDLFAPAEKEWKGKRKSQSSTSSSSTRLTPS